MHSVAGTFDACHHVFDRAGAIGLFPEGITYDDERLKTLKTGAARLALECVERHQAASGATSS